MNETLKVIRNRRSIKKYQAKEIADSELQAILEAAIYAPNSRNQQKWHFTVIQGKKIIDRLVETIKENIMNSNIEFLKQRANTPGYHTFHNAPAVIMISGDEKAPFIQIDCGAAAENIALAAESMNIGSNLMTSPELLFASPKVKEQKKELGIPDGYCHMCTVVLGYKDGPAPDTPPRSKDVINYIK
ncbi:MAG: hypothetical protein A2144_08115 [Chloroflexi bacterium RBG_16_50_9]|nr:MAG: hypothetical protein A2144_08115 [Chloroflexi bacterium RBG_16_50_9]